MSGPSRMSAGGLTEAHTEWHDQWESNCLARAENRAKRHGFWPQTQVATYLYPLHRAATQPVLFHPLPAQSAYRGYQAHYYDQSISDIRSVDETVPS